MMTKNDIFDAIMRYIDYAIFASFFTTDEVAIISELEKEYYIQSEE